jgi:hypothetical protein
VKPAPHEQPWFGLGPAFLASLGFLRRRPVVLPALGAAIVLSLLSVFCGIGLVTTPWFICELFATQLVLCTAKPLRHNLTWVPAGMILLGAVVLVTGVVSLTLVGAGAELPPEATPVSGMTTLLRSSGFYAATSGTLGLLFLVPVLYAPLVLLERGVSLPEALLESVRIVVRRGLWTSLCFSLVAHLVQLAPLLAAAAWAAYGARSVVLSLLAAAPLLALSVPLGQGMIIWSYVAVQANVARVEPSSSAGTERTQNALRTIASWTKIWSFVVALPILALLLLGMSLARPSRLPAGAAPAGEPVCELAIGERGVRRAELHNTALELSASPEWVRVVAADGGGTGELELRDDAPITGVRVVRVRDAFAVEVRQGNTRSLTWVDRAGVRLDDDLRARLTDRVSARGVAFVLLFPFLVTLGTVPVLHRLSRVQHAFRKFGDRRPSDEVLDLALRRSVRRTQVYVALLLPLDLFALGLAARALGLW